MPLDLVIPAFYTTQGVDSIIGMYWNYDGSTYTHINAKNCTQTDISTGNFDKLIVSDDYVLQCPDDVYQN